MDNAAERLGPQPRPVLTPGPSVSARGADLEDHATSFLEPLERVFATLRRMASNFALLGILDLRRAAIQFAWLVASGILITVLVVTAWLALVVAVAVLLLGQGLSWPAVLAVAALLNLIGAALVAWRVKHVFDEAPFSATLKQIKSIPPAGEAKSDDVKRGG